MTEHFTMQEAVELARECGGLLIGGLHTLGRRELHTLVNTAVTRKLAEKELEVVRLREALDQAYGWAPIGSLSKRLIGEALSTPSSTKYLDEYVAGKVKPLKEEIHNLKWALGAEGYETMATPEQQEEADAANRTAMELIEAIPKRMDVIADLTSKLAAAEERVKELVDLLKDARNDCEQVLHSYLPHAGYERYDRLIAYQKYLIARIDAAIEAGEGRTE